MDLSLRRRQCTCAMIIRMIMVQIDMDLESGAADKRKGISDRNGKTKKIQVLQTLTSLVTHEGLFCTSLASKNCVKVFCFYTIDFLKRDVQSRQKYLCEFSNSIGIDPSPNA